MIKRWYLSFQKNDNKSFSIDSRAKYFCLKIVMDFRKLKTGNRFWKAKAKVKRKSKRADEEEKSDRSATSVEMPRPQCGTWSSSAVQIFALFFIFRSFLFALYLSDLAMWSLMLSNFLITAFIRWVQVWDIK